MSGRGSTVARSVERVLGGSVDHALWPLVVVDFVLATAGTLVWVFLPVYAAVALDASGRAIGSMFLAAAVLGAGAGAIGGYVSDHVGRRRVVLAGMWVSALLGIVLIAAGDNVGFALGSAAIVAAASSVSDGADDALVADLVPPERRPAAFAVIRVVSNLGHVVGPLIGAVLLYLADYTAIFVTSTVLQLGGIVLALALLPSRGAFAADEPPARGSWRAVLADSRFALFLTASVFAWLAYFSYEVLLPVSLTTSYGVSARTWGLLLTINPLLVVVFQVRLTGFLIPRFALRRVFSAGVLLMALPFVALELSAAPWFAAALIVLFVIGEMLWVPAAQAMIAELARDDLRGAYYGAAGAAPAAGLALAPLSGLAIRDAEGDLAMWLAVAAAGGISVALIVATGRIAAGGRPSG